MTLAQNINSLNETDLFELSNGFDAGNYAQAYETTFYDAQASRLDGQTGYYRIGYLLGFFSSYELDEIFDDEVRCNVEYFRTKFGDIYG